MTSSQDRGDTPENYSKAHSRRSMRICPQESNREGRASSERERERVTTLRSGPQQPATLATKRRQRDPALRVTHCNVGSADHVTSKSTRPLIMRNCVLSHVSCLRLPPANVWKQRQQTRNAQGMQQPHTSPRTDTRATPYPCVPRCFPEYFSLSRRLEFIALTCDKLNNNRV